MRSLRFLIYLGCCLFLSSPWATTLGELALAPCDFIYGLPTKNIQLPYGMQLQLRKLKERIDKEPSTQTVIKKLRELLAGGEGVTGSAFARALKEPGDNLEKKAVSDYLFYALHRRKVAVETSAAEQREAAEIDPALMKTHIDLFLDRIMQRLLETKTPLTPEASQALENLTHGGAERIQTRADTWMLNDKISKIVESEEWLSQNHEVNGKTLMDALVSLDELDGGTPFGYQRVTKPGETRVRMIGGPSPSMSLVAATSHALIRPEQVNQIKNIADQSPHTQSAVEKIEHKLSTLETSDPAYATSRDVYQTYLNMVLYNPAKLWGHKGMFDKLAEDVVTFGSEEQKIDFLDFLHDHQEKIGERLIKAGGFLGDKIGYRNVYVELRNLVLSGQMKKRGDLDFAFRMFKKLSEVEDVGAYSRKSAKNDYDLVRAKWQELFPSLDDFRQSLQQEGKQSAKIGAFNIQYEVIKNGLETTVAVDRLSTSIDEDSQYYFVHDQIEEAAKNSGATRFQMRELSNIHVGRVLEGNLGYTKQGPTDRRDRTPPTYTKDFGPRKAPPVKRAAPATSTNLERDKFKFLLDRRLGSRGSAKVGNFDFSFRTSDFSTDIGVSQKKIFVMTLVDADNPGSGQYPDFLKNVEADIKEKGFDTFLVEGVTDLRQQQFYLRQGFQRAEKSSSQNPSFYRFIK